MKMFRLGLISRIALLVACVEIAAFSALGWFYTDRFSSAIDERTYSHLHLVGQMIANEELEISSISRQSFVSDLVGAPYLNGMVIGGNGLVIVSTNPSYLGRMASSVSGFDARWIADSAPAEEFIPGKNTLTAVMHIRSALGGSPMYTTVITISTAELTARKRSIALWGLLGSLLFILLSTAGIVLIAQRLITRRVNITLKVLKEVEDGALDVRIPISSDDELGQLQRGINSMTAKVGALLNQHRRNEEEIRATSQLLDSIIENIPNMIFLKRASDLRFVLFNKAGEQLLGFDRQDMLGKNDYDLFPKEQADFFTANDREVLRSSAVLDIPEETIAARGGDKHILHTQKLALHDRQGEAEYLLGISEDITERKWVGEALRVNEERLKLATTAGNIGIWDWDVVNNVLTWDESMYALYGILKEDFGGAYDAWSGMLHPDDRQFVEDEIQAALRGEREYAPEFRIVRPDGTVRIIKAASKTYRDPQGNPTRMVGINLDISERKKVEQDLTQLSLQNRLILDSAGEGIYGLDIDGQCTFVNPAALQLLGFKVEELLGQHSHSMFHHTKPDGRPYPVEECPVLAAYKQGTVHRGSDLYQRKDGSSFPVEFISTPIMEAGEITGAVVTFRDVTERKLAEEQLRRSEHSLAEAQRIAHLGNWNLDLVKNVLTWSDEIYRIFEIDPEKFGASYEAFLNAIHPDDRELVNKTYSESIENRTPYDIEHRLLMKDGRVKYVNEKCETYYGEDGKPLRSVGAVHDVTERKKAEEELRKYKDHLEEEVQQRTADLVLALKAAEAANRAKSAFLSSMSHELRTPMNAILGFSNMLRKDPLLSQEQRENLDIINRSGEHLLTLINDVLEMAKIEAGRVQLESTPFDLGGVVRDVTDMMHVRAQEQGLQLLVDQSSEFPRYIKGDEARLRQVLINLVGNAIKFTSQGGVTLRFGMKPHATPQRLLIEVEDSGIGIKQEDQQRIFEPFVQLGQTATQKGTGLGLTLTRQFVQLMDGAISVESTPGKGSTFRVELPAEKVAAADVVKPEGGERGEIVGLAPGQPEFRILIVEDQLENQLLLAKLMKSVGVPVRVADNGEQAIEVFQSWRPHLIWMDRRMPVMDGVEATQRIRELPGGKEVKIVAVTASAFAEQRDEMLKAGMDDFVRKPYRFNEIYECLTRQLGVQYTYADAQTVEEVIDEVLTAEMLAVLPPELCRELRAALESLEGERISAVIQQVASSDSKLHKTLSHLAGNFDYPAILKALQTN